MAVIDTVMNALTSCRTGYLGKSYVMRVAGFVRNRMRYRRLGGSSGFLQTQLQQQPPADDEGVPGRTRDGVSVGLCFDPLHTFKRNNLGRLSRSGVALESETQDTSALY